MKDSQTTAKTGIIVPHIRAIKRQKVDHASGPFHRAVLQTLDNQVPGRSPDECWPVAREWERNPGKWDGRLWCSRRKCLREVFGEVGIHGRMRDWLVVVGGIEVDSSSAVRKRDETKEERRGNGREGEKI
jgi:hypothetical protein